MEVDETMKDPETNNVSPLHEIRQRLGAVCGASGGQDVVLHYGDVADEEQALSNGVGWAEAPARELLEMAGADRQRFLNGLVTCEVKSLVAGGGNYGFVTSAKGKILADLQVLATEDRLLLSLPAGTGEEIAAHLGKYIIVDRVEIQPAPSPVVVDFIGPRSLQLLAALGGPGEVPPVHAHGSRVLGPASGRWVWGSHLAGLPRWSLWLSQDESAGGLEVALEVGKDLGLRAIGHLARERLRIHAGEPVFGSDFGPENFPQETGLTDAVSFTKGCYLGQEVVARIHYRGGVNRFLRGLSFACAAGEEPVVGSSVVLDGREVGRLTSSCRLSDDRCLGLGILHKRAEPGGEVEISGDGSANVSAWVEEVPPLDESPA